MLLKGNIPNGGFSSLRNKASYAKLNLDFKLITGEVVIDKEPINDTGSNGSVNFILGSMLKSINLLGDNLDVSKTKIDSFSKILHDFPKTENFFKYFNKVNLEGLTQVGAELKVFNFYINSTFINLDYEKKFADEIKSVWNKSISGANNKSQVLFLLGDSSNTYFSSTMKLKKNEITFKNEVIPYPLDDTSTTNTKEGFTANENIKLFFKEVILGDVKIYPCEYNSSYITAVADSIKQISSITIKVDPREYNDIINL